MNLERLPCLAGWWLVAGAVAAQPVPIDWP